MSDALPFTGYIYIYIYIYQTRSKPIVYRYLKYKRNMDNVLDDKFFNMQVYFHSITDPRREDT